MSATLEKIRTLYGTATPTKTGIKIFITWGSSMSNGYAAAWNQLSAEDQAEYTPDADIPGIYRLDGLNQNGTMAVKLLNRNDNTGAASLRFGNETISSIELKKTGVWNTIGLHAWSANGTSIILGDGVSWSPSDNTTTGRLFVASRELEYYLKRLYLLGYKATIVGLNFQNYVYLVEHTEHTQQEYETAIDEFITSFRARFSFYGGNNTFIMWDALDHANSETTSYRNAVLARAASDSKFGYYDYLKYPPMSNDTIHPRTWSVRMNSKFVASFYEKMRSGNNYPTAAGVSITGTLQQGQTINVNYTYSDVDGDEEGLTEVEYLYADDTNGTNIVRIGQLFKGNSSLQLISTYNNKYIKARVTPIALTGAKVGYPTDGAWQGPVIA